METHPTNCRETFAVLSDYVDSELPAEVRSHVETHLAGCPECLEFVQSLRKAIALCHDYAPCPILAPLCDRARSELETAWRKMLAARERPAE